MKKIISFLLAFAMLATMTAGLNLTAYAAEVEGIELNLAGSPFEVYEGWHGYTETGLNGDYYVYDFGPRDLCIEGSTFEIFYDDNTSKIYECVRQYRGDNEDDYYLTYKCGDEELELWDLFLETDQSAENIWQLGESHTVSVFYQGASDEIGITIVENPVESVTVDYDRPITLAEHCEGEWDEEENPEDNWFFYYANYHYLNDAGVTIQVEYKNGDSEKYSYFGNDWLPKNENGDEIDEAFFDFSFNQMRTENHFNAGDEGRSATVTFYGKGIFDLPVNIVSGDIDSGEIAEGWHRKILFIGNENHNITFTPEQDGLYIFEESLADRLVWESHRFTGSMTDEFGNNIQSISNEWLAFVLEGGVTYTLQARKIEESGPMFEFLHVRNVNSSISINFTPNWNDNIFYDGNLTTDDSLFIEGNQIEVAFSDGDVQTFICNDDRRYVCYGENNEFGDDGIEIGEYANQKGIEFDCNVRSSIDTGIWEKGGNSNYIDVYVGTAYQRVYVDDYIQDSPYSEISMTGGPIQVYYGTAQTRNGMNSRGEWVEYQCYDVNRWDLEEDGNTLTVTDLDGNEKTYTFCWSDTDRTRKFRCGDETIDTEELIVMDGQWAENEWQLGETYEISVYFRGQHCSFYAQVVDTPVDYIEITANRDIEIFENCNGHWEYDNNTDSDYFRYDESFRYFRAINPAVTVHYNDGTVKVYDYQSQFWLPCDENDEPLNDRYLEFYFDQDDNHFTPGGQNKAIIKYYGVPYELDVNVVQQHDVDEGEITTEARVPLIFLNCEEHYLTFTPERSGVYEFRNSLADMVIHSEDFSFTVTNSSGDEIDRISSDRDGLFFNLYADEEYTVTVKRNFEGMAFEYLDVELRTSVKKVEYSHAGGTIYVSEGDIGNGREIYDDGSTLTVTFSDGTVETFTADRGEFRNDDGKQPQDIGYELDVYINCELRINANVNFWVRGQAAYYTLTVGNAGRKVNVTVNSSEVEGIEYHAANPTRMIKGVDFEYEEENEFLRINKDPFFSGDTVDVTYSDERGTVTYQYDNDNAFYVETEDGRDYIYLNYAFDNSHDYDIGDDMEFEIAFQTGRYALTAEVAENDVDRIEFTTDYPYYVYKNYRGWWEHRDFYDEQNDVQVNEDFFHYDNPDIFIRGNVLTVYYTDGSSAEFVYNGRWFMDEDGNTLDFRYIRTEDDQWNTHWDTGENNEFYVSYKNAQAPVSIEVIDLGEWELNAWVRDSRGNVYGDGDTLRLEKGQRVFLYFESHPENRDHGIGDIIGFSDGYDGGTLSNRGFDVETGNDHNFGYNFGDTYGMMLGSNNLRVGTTGQLYYFLYEFEGDNYDDFDFVNTPHAADFTLNVEIVDHQFEPANVVPATCTEKGYTEYTCALCGITFRSDFTDYAPHSFDETVIPAGPNSRGYTHYSCQNCDYECTGNYTDYASDASVLLATIQRSHYYSNSALDAQSIQQIIDGADSYAQLAQTNAPQDEYDYAIGDIITNINSVDPMAAYSPTAIDNDTVTLANTDGDEVEVSFIDNINIYSAPLDVDRNGIVNIRDYSYIIKSYS